ncbi:MAG: DUF937 domain-containing protein [Ignavibacteria bacterium]|jgi:uncharacterized protein YidB (DUF937 family)|nr:DUF937 domain-containing protein [Ignavibacteria bacterium]MCU7504644.1 DUF937 domain-containing protein [Ignavibacteria bacterium]MCU7517548.1 DUF937 domain-containing protein [Ignavibacteria bacterium]
MGLMDDIKGAAGGVLGNLGGQNSGIVNALLQMFSHNEQGGLQGMIQSFQQKGLGNAISSWIGKGENQPVSKEQIREGMGEERIQNLATKTGQSPDNVTSKLQEVLPNVVDKLTPEGNVPQDNMLQQGINFLKEKL